MADNSPSKTKERLEGRQEVISEGQKPSLSEYRKQAEKVKSDPNLEAAERIRKIDGSKESFAQREGLLALNTAITSVLTKLIKKGADIREINSAKELQSAITKYNVLLNLPESTAVENINRIAGTSGPTSQQIKESWSDTIESAQEASKGWAGQYWGHMKKNPVATTALTIAGAAGIYLTAKAIKSLFKKAIGDENADKSKDGEVGGKSWMKKEIIIPAAILIGGAFLGKEKIKELMALAGLDYFGIKDKVKKGEEFTKEERRKIEKAGPIVQAQVERMKNKEGADTEAETASVAVSARENFVDEEGVKAESETEKELKETAEALEAEALEASKFELPRALLIQMFCSDRYKYDPNKDIPQIRRVMDDISGEKMSDIITLWSEHSAKGTEGEIPHSTKLTQFDEYLEEKNIFTTIRILGVTAIEYQKRFPDTDFSKISLREFFEKNMRNDSVTHVNQAVNDALNTAITQGSVLSLSKLNDIDLEGLGNVLEDMATNSIDQLASDYEINLEEVNKNHFTVIVTSLYRNATLQMDADTAMRHIDVSKYDPKAVESAKRFYEKVSERTKAEIIPAAHKRFNIDTSNSENKDIIKNYLTDAISFKRAVQLNLVTRSINLNQDVNEGSSNTQELAFLFTVLSSIPKEQKARYIPELAVLMAKSPSNIKLPSLAFIQPYFKKIGGFAFDRLKTEVKGAGYWLSAFMPNRSPEEQEEFMKEMRNAEFFEFATATAVEGTGGAIQVAKDFMTPFIESGAITIEELGHCKDPMDFILLAKKAGATFIYGKDENGKPHGMIHFMGNFFVFKPIGVLKETFDAALDGELGGAFQVYSAGIAPSITIGAVRGYLKARAGKGGWLSLVKARGAVTGAGKGFLYPYYALKKTYGAAKFGASSVVNISSAIGEYKRRPGQIIGQLGRKAKDAVKFRSAFTGPNVANMMENAKWFHHYHEASKDLEDLRFSQKLDYLKNNPRSLVRQLGKSFDHRMTIRYASDFADQYNKFFGLRHSDSTHYLNVELIKKGNVAEIGKLNAHLERLRNFFGSVDSYDDVFKDMLALSRSNTVRHKMVSEMTKLIRKMKDIDPVEAKALAENIYSSKDVERLRSRMTDGAKMATEHASNKPNVATKLLEKLRKSTEAEKGRSFGKVKSAIVDAQKELSSVERQIIAAKRDFSVARRMGNQEAVDKARQIIQQAENAKAKINASLDDLDFVRDIEEKLKLGTGDADKLKRQLDMATELAEESLFESKSATQSIGKASKLGRGLQLLGRTMAVGGAVTSVWSAGSSAFEAMTTDVEGRAGIKGAEAAMWGVNAAADIGSAAVLFGSTGTTATVASYAALPLVPLTYAGSTVFETLNEETKTDYEWAQGNPYETLHNFYTSMNSISLGDAWIGGFKAIGRSPAQLAATATGLSTISAITGIETKGQQEAFDKSFDESLKNKTETMHKIFRGLVAIQKDPTLLDYIAKESPSEEKNKEVERRINASYNINHEFYFQHNASQGVQSYASAQKYILEAQMFDDVMQKRDEAKAKGKKFELDWNGARFSLHEDRYDIIGGMENPHGRKMFLPGQIVKAYKENMMKQIEADPIIAENLERMDTSYLLRLYVQMNKILSDPKKREQLMKTPDTLRAVSSHMAMIRNYLTMKRNVNFNLDVRKPENHEPKMSLKTVLDHLEGIGSIDNSLYLSEEEKHYNKTPALNAMYRLAEYFGYSGEPTEAKLKEFFNEDTASFHGVYWNGDSWMLQERGYEFDDKMGTELNIQTIQNIIDRMLEQPDNILEHRHDAIFLDAYDYSHEVENMAKILEAGFNEGKKRQQKEYRQAA